MKSFMKLILCSLFLFTATTFASAIITLDGKIKSFTTAWFELDDGHNIYVIQKDKINEADVAMVEKLRSGQRVTMHVPLTSISEVKFAKK